MGKILQKNSLPHIVLYQSFTTSTVCISIQLHTIVGRNILNVFENCDKDISESRVKVHMIINAQVTFEKGETNAFVFT